jgi:hypothetical protein
MDARFPFPGALSWEEAAASVSLPRRCIDCSLTYLGLHYLDSMIYARGPSEDFDRLANVSGDPGWSWESLQEFIFKVHNVAVQQPAFLNFIVGRMKDMFLRGTIEAM